MTDHRAKQSDTSPPSRNDLPAMVSSPPRYKFQELEVYGLALQYLDDTYKLSQSLPGSEKYNLRSQLERAATSVVLNIAEGSTGLSDPEQSRFVSMALRSYLETAACLDIVERRGYHAQSELDSLRNAGHLLFMKLQAFRRSLGAPVPRPRSSVS